MFFGFEENYTGAVSWWNDTGKAAFETLSKNGEEWHDALYDKISDLSNSIENDTLYAATSKGYQLHEWVNENYSNRLEPYRTWTNPEEIEAKFSS